MMGLFGTRGAPRQHISDDVLLRLSNHELSPARASLARSHLIRCERCRARYESLERTALAIVEHHQSMVKRLELSSARRDQFIRQLDLLLESSPARPWWKRLPIQFVIRPFGNTALSFRGALVIVFAGIIVFSVWRWQLTAVSASEFLDRAVASEHEPAKVVGSGMICRRFRFKTVSKTIQHAVYWDASGRRQPKYSKVAAEEAELDARLAVAGVNWDDPLSATSFKRWHDRQADPNDEVRPSGEGLLTISTRLPSTTIARESLTVREEDFHPVERTIEYREFGTVDISEDSLEVLSRDRVDELFFEPNGDMSAAARRVPARVLPPSTAQLNETELQARLILNQRDADTGEQIEVIRDVRGVQVQGLVESGGRKKELEKSLQGIPFLFVAIRSFDDLKAVPSPGAQTSVTQRRSTVAQVSPLEQYFVQHGRSRDDLSRISAGLFNSSLAINRTSRSIEQIVFRFSSSDDLSPIAIHARDELLARTVARLLHHLEEQQQFLQEAEITSESEAIVPRNPDERDFDFVRLAERNMAATRELVSGASESRRSEKPAAEELAETISQLRCAALGLHSAPPQQQQ